MIEKLVAETTECDFKVAIETKKPKSLICTQNPGHIFTSD